MSGRTISFAGLAEQLHGAAAAMERRLCRGLERAAQLVAQEARGEIGAGGEGSASLAESIRVHAEGAAVVVGSNDARLVERELGSSDHPPSPVLVPALQRQMESVEQVLGAAVRDGIVGGGGDNPVSSQASR